MTENTRLVHATPEQVWSVIADGWLYPLWVVGAARMRDVDDSWPTAGSKLYHSVGSWPLLLDDETEVLDATPGRSITLRARAWPVGEAQVHLRLDSVGVETEVRITEEPVSGPGALVPRPLVAPSLKWRNTETLRRLALVAEHRK
ncbi:Polyketide cyclase / dehydrase and lipid transport [Nocardioides exalbidus]|uniref:Polyketide cyclase / dehydrase and lipid transport n=1 Tax=Nocardioides exalbidus TaxID=402596 RepID=A0A1H4WM10_9ACTN|nr:SRPBCC family protein [Nocardioides exalbidus]SEC94372.1 Polyketide cyclase / dehydrase and lipid transport [Nocardioides exalbidus]